jgi:transcriptional regulator with XRE-family HTH domain
MPNEKPNSIDIAVGARVRIGRLENGKSQEWLGNALGLTFQQVQKYEKGTNRIGSSRMVQIATALQKPVAWFYQGSETKLPPGVDIVTQVFALPYGIDIAKACLAIENIDRSVVLHVAEALAGKKRASIKRVA